MALFTGRGFGAAANSGFQSGFAGALQLLLQSKSEALQRELEGARAKQQKDQFDQQMAAERERSDRDFLFAEKRAQKQDINTEIDRLTRKNERSMDESMRTADRIAEENYRASQLDLQREEADYRKKVFDAEQERRAQEDAPIDPSVAERMKAVTGYDFSGMKKSDINTYLASITTGKNVEASNAQIENERARTDITRKEQASREEAIKREAMSSLMSTFLKDEAALAKELSDVSQRSIEEQVASAIKLQESAIDESEKARYAAIIQKLSNQVDRAELVQKSNELAVDIVAEKIMSHPVYKKLIDSVDGGEQLREFIREKQAMKPKTDTTKVENGSSAVDMEMDSIKKKKAASEGDLEFSFGDKTWKVTVPDPITENIPGQLGLLRRVIGKTKNVPLGQVDYILKQFGVDRLSKVDDVIKTPDFKLKMVEAYEKLRKSGRGAGWANTFTDAMNNEAFRKEIFEMAIGKFR